MREPDGLNCLRLSQLAEGDLSQFFAGYVGSGEPVSAASLGEPSLLELQTAMTQGFSEVQKTLAAMTRQLDALSQANSLGPGRPRRHLDTNKKTAKS